MLFIFEQYPIERVCEGYDCIVHNFLRVLYAYYVLRSRLLEYATNEFRVARGHENKL